MPAQIDKNRALGCLTGQLAGDTLGALVKFKTPGQIQAAYPNGVRKMEAGGSFGIAAGQPTDDSEMALALAYSLARLKKYDPAAVRNSYKNWLLSGPFDISRTIANALNGTFESGSQSNGAIMRVSPLAIFCARPEVTNEQITNWARLDCRLTHTGEMCQDANVVFVRTIALAIRTGLDRKKVVSSARETVKSVKLDPAVKQAVRDGCDGIRPKSYTVNPSWVVIALQNAFYQLAKAPNPEEAIVDTLVQGGDTDTNAAVAGALLGAACGAEAFPEDWRKTLAECRPSIDDPKVPHHRPRLYWPADALNLIKDLIS